MDSFFTTSGSFVDCVDRKMLVVLRDGRKLHGVRRSYDQFANLVLEDTVERIYHGNVFAENWHGLFLIGGENIVPLGEIARFAALFAWYLTDLRRWSTRRSSVQMREEAKAQILYEHEACDSSCSGLSFLCS
ncbi:Sm-like ribonucleoprotein [Mycena latifolia]|nr:Sm-like ribonucleoprotein [Mycena latifolia]